MLSEKEYERRAQPLRESGDLYDKYHRTSDLPDNLRTLPTVKNNMNVENGSGNFGYQKDNT